MKKAKKAYKYPCEAKPPKQPEPTPAQPVRAHYKLATEGLKRV